MRNSTSPLSKRYLNTQDLSSVTWSKYFDIKESVELPSRNGTFNVYQSGFNAHDTKVVLFLIHGAGASGLSWALFVKAITSSSCQCACLAVDMRGHGDTSTNNDSDFATKTLVDDMEALIETCVPDLPICIIGHSLGGSVATNLANKLSNSNKVKLLVMIDLSEGNAMSGRSSMERMLGSRPRTFKTMDDAIAYLVSSGQVRNVASARISANGYFQYLSSEEIEQCPLEFAQSDSSNLAFGLENISEASSEFNKDDVSKIDLVENINFSLSLSPTDAINKSHIKNSCDTVKWRVQLSPTAYFWEDWFLGLSSLFLSIPIPKLVILNSLHKLDTELTIGQMRGQFQLKVFPHGGHALNEDVPRELSEVILTFLKRHNLINV